MFGNSSGGRGVRGLTVIEVVVVLSVLGFVFLVLMNAPHGNRDGAVRVACSSRLRGIAVAASTYAAEDVGQNIIPISGAGRPGYGYGGKSGCGSGGDQSMWSSYRSMGPLSRPLNQYIYKAEDFDRGVGLAGESDGKSAEVVRAGQRLELDLYSCPGDKGFSGMHHRAWRDEAMSSYDHYGTSFVANLQWIENPTDVGKVMSNSPYMKPVSVVPKPGETVAYLENSARFAAFAQADPEKGVDGGSARFGAEYVGNGWHKRPWHFNAAFVDGHVSWLKVRGTASLEAWGEFAEMSEAELKAVQPFVMRNRGWRMDTYPATPVQTDIRVRYGEAFQAGDPESSEFDVVP